MNFSPYPTPKVLEELLTFQEVSRDWYSQGFELEYIPRKILKSHVKEDVIPDLFCFGRDRNYSVYALWKYDNLSLEEAPVVYLNSEGEGSGGVFTNDLYEFLMLLARDEEPVFGKYSYKTDNEIEHQVRNLAFREWLAKQYHIYAATQPDEMVRLARLKHPALPLI